MPLNRRNALGLGAAALSGIGIGPGAVVKAIAGDKLMLGGEKFPTRSGELTIHPVNHASVVLGTGDIIIYVDPVGDPALYASLPEPDLILITHEHGDHFAIDTLEALMGDNTVLVTNPAVFDMLPAKLKSVAQSLANGQSGEAKQIPIEAMPAYNTTPERQKFHPRDRDNGYILTIDGTRIYIAGDTEDTPEMRALTNIGLAFVPMNLPYTMTVDQAANGVLAFAPQAVYPYHYRGSDIEQFKALVEAGNGDIEVRLGNWY